MVEENEGLGDEGLGVAASSGGRSGGPPDPSQQAVSAATAAPATNAGFTPGPWVICEDPRGFQYIESRPDDATPDIIAHVFADNAPLIEAAPDLLNALAPFAREAALYADTVPDSLVPTIHCLETGMESLAAYTVGDLRRAAAISKALGKAA
jgi:hypothetical protein